MKRTLYIISMIAAALAVAGCDADKIDNQFIGNGTVCFQPAVSPNSGGSPVTRAAELSSADGNISIPLWCEVVDGIGDEKAVATKGEQLNTSGSNQALADFATKIGSHFYVAAWKNGSSFIPADTEVTCQNGSWSTATQYQWPASSEATFYAYANLPASDAAVSCTSDASQSLTYTVPADASAQNDILMGFYQGLGRYDATLHKGGNADIVFHHPLTAVCFKLKPGAVSGATEVSVKKISIRNVHSSGVARMTSVSAMEGNPGDRFIWTPGDGFTTVTLGDGTSDLTIDSENDYVIGEPFILIPQDMSENPVRFTVVLDIDGTETTLEATRNINAWEAGKTNVYTLGYDTADFTFSLDSDAEVTSITKTYQSKTSDYASETIAITSLREKGSAVEDWNWDIKSYQIGSGTPVNVAASETGFTAGGLEVSEISSGDINTDLSIKAKKWESYLPGSNSYWKNESGRTDDLDWSPESWGIDGLSKGTIDLSKFNFQNETTDNAMNTANCYIIRHAGTYKFPLVYGNGIVDGAFNEESYYPNPSTSDDCTLQRFVNHTGYGIKSPFIEYNTSDGEAKSSSNTYLAPASVQVVWSENANIILLPGLSQETVSVKDGNGTSHNYTVSYITFTISQFLICNNSAVIAVKDAGGNVMWSWHIWTTNDPALLEPAISVTNYSGNERGFFPIPCVGLNYGITYRERDDVVITLVQKTSGKTLKVTVEQPKTLPDGRPTGSYYQWGRKDPMPDNTPTGFLVENGRVSLETAILNPDKFYKNTDGDITSSMDWCDYTDNTKFYCNLWTGKHNSAGPAEESSNMTKTVYDPSPVGYKVPAAYVHTGFTTTGAMASSAEQFNVEGSYAMGWKFYTNASRTATIRFPEIQYRNYKGVLVDNIPIGRYWSSTPDVRPAVNGSYELQFNSTSVSPATRNAAKSQALPIRPIAEQ